MIMCANGIREELFIEIFTEAVEHTKGLTGRVQAGKTTKDDYNLLSLCSDVSC